MTKSSPSELRLLRAMAGPFADHKLSESKFRPGFPPSNRDEIQALLTWKPDTSSHRVPVFVFFMCAQVHEA